VKITTQLARHKTDRQRQAVIFEGGRHAVTRLRVDGRFGNPDAVALVSCWLETGRTHQIRAHMAHIGHGLIGDPVYGRARKIAKTAFGFDTFEKLAAFPRQALHAAVLGFVHPNTDESMRFEVEMPQDMASLMHDLHNTNA
jgi:23S rRNA pseudouridine1911/1915/1917 synthase